MADNVRGGSNDGTLPLIATDDVGGAQYQRVKLDVGGDGASTPVTSSGLPVNDAGGSLTVDGSVSVSNFPATQPVSGTVSVTGVATEATLDARTGSLTETAPASDTASSGLNGRLQRIAQRLTSLIALLPTSIGQKNSAGSLSVVLSSDHGAVTVTGSGGDGAILDGASSSIKASVLDYTNSNPLAVRLTDTAGDYVGAGAGTQYTEDAAAAADPTGTALIMVRDDALSGQTTTDGDNVAARGTDKGELYVKHVDAIPVTDNAGSLTVDGTVGVSGTVAVTQSGTWDEVGINDSGNSITVDDGGSSLTVDGTVGVSGTVTVDSELTTADLDTGAGTDTRAVVGIVGSKSGGAALIPGDATAGLKVDLGADNDVTVTGTVTANAGTGPFPVSDNGGSLTVDGTVAVTNADLSTLASAIKNEDVASANADPGMVVHARRTDSPANTATTDGDYQPLQMGSGRLWASATIDAAIPAGTNNIGDVDVLTVPSPLSTAGNGTAATAHRVTIASDSTGQVAVASIAAGNNNIGDVDVASVPSPLSTAGNGTAATAHRVTIASDSTGQVALAAGTNAIGKLTANSGVDIGDVDVTSVTPGTGATNLGKVEDAAHTTGDVGVMVLGVRNDAGVPIVSADGDYTPLATDETGALQVTASPNGLDVSAFGGFFDVILRAEKQEDVSHATGDEGIFILGVRTDAPSQRAGSDGDYSTINTNAEGGVWTSQTPSALGGCSIFRSLDIDETEEEIKSSAGTLYGWFITNTATATRWVKFYNATAANVTVGTTTPVLTFGIPGNSSDDVGANVLGGIGIKFDTAMTVAATTGVADNDTGAPAANDVIINVFYK